MVTLHLSTSPAAGDLRRRKVPWAGWVSGPARLLARRRDRGGGGWPGRRQGPRALGWGHIHLPRKDTLSP